MQQPPMRTCFFYFGNKRWQEEVQECWPRLLLGLCGHRSPTGVKAGGWLQASLGQGGGCVRCWGTQQLPVQPGPFLWLSATCVWKECPSCLFHQINVCIYSRVAAAFWCDVVLWFFGSYFNKDFWGPSLGVGKVESCLKLQSCFPPRRSSQLYIPPLFCLCPGRNTPTCTDISLSLFFPKSSPILHYLV